MLDVLAVLNVLSLFITIPVVVGTYVAAVRGGRKVALEVLYRTLPVFCLATFIGTASAAAHHYPGETVAASIGAAASFTAWIMIWTARARFRDSE